MKLTKYEQLKDGMRVKCTIDGTDIDDAKLSVGRYGRVYICQNEKDGLYAKDTKGYKYSWFLASPYGGLEDWDEDVSDLHTAGKDISDIDSYEIGDVLTDDDGQERTVLGVCGKVVFLSGWRGSESYDNGFTPREVKACGYRFRDSDEEVGRKFDTNDGGEYTLVGKEATVEIEGKKYLVQVKEEQE